ncbi:MAG: DUF447 domain-containing protein [Planctomycetaceae bacterium]
MILEGIVTSRDGAGQINVAPMGPVVDTSMSQFQLRPFKSSQTYRNLRESPHGVFHVVDDVLLMAQAAVDRLPELPTTFPALKIPGDVLKSACRWYEFTVESVDDGQDRTMLLARVVHSGRLRDCFGFNRAKHAVIEAAILATRLHLVGRSELRDELQRLSIIVDKTAGHQERAAFELLMSHIEASDD